MRPSSDLTRVWLVQPIMPRVWMSNRVLNMNAASAGILDFQFWGLEIRDHEVGAKITMKSTKTQCVAMWTAEFFHVTTIPHAEPLHQSPQIPHYHIFTLSYGKFLIN